MAPAGVPVRPLLKWAGGKRQLLPQLRDFYPDRIDRYFEPFVGSGAVFFDLWSSGRLDTARIVLADQNADLIGCYLRIRDSIDDVVTMLQTLAHDHARDARASYYRVRDELFNPERRAWRESGGRAVDYSPSLASMLIYLNRTGYNGLFRVNRDGEFNVPAGRYDRPTVLDERRLRAVGAVLSSPRVEIEEAPFETACRKARAGDLVYFDPPYAPLTATASFQSYTAAGFNDLDQKRLQQLAIELARRGVSVMLSNSTAPAIGRLYEANTVARAAGLRVYRLAARRAINSRAHLRGPIDEFLVTNCRAADRRASLTRQR